MVSVHINFSRFSLTFAGKAKAYPSGASVTKKKSFSRLAPCKFSLTRDAAERLVSCVFPLVSGQLIRPIVV
jgi:hypothetical protein